MARRHRPGLGGDPRRDRARRSRRTTSSTIRSATSSPTRRDAASATRAINLVEYSGDDEASVKAKVDALLAEIAQQARHPGRAAWPRDHLEGGRAREPVEPAQEGRRAPGQRAGAAQARALRGGHGRPAREPASVRARVPRAPRRRGPALRHVRPRRRRLPARPARARPQGPRGRSPRAAHHRRGDRARDALRGLAVGRARQGLPLRARAAPLRSGPLPRAAADQGGVRSAQPAQSRARSPPRPAHVTCSRASTARRAARSTARSPPPTARRWARSSTATATGSASTRAPTT